MMSRLSIVGLAFAWIAAGGTGMQEVKAVTFGEDLEFLKKHVDVIVLSDSAGASQMAIVPQYQGRVMTSSAAGLSGSSCGWINRELIASGENKPHINVYGGEERFWLGPEGGQFSIFFQNNAPFDLEHWQVPALIDTEPFDVVSKDASKAVFQKKANITNTSGTSFDLLIDREVRLLGRKDLATLLKVSLPESVKMVGYETRNKITNTGKEAWKKETGLLSIWLLGMFNPAPKTTIVVPFVPGPEKDLGPKVNDAYFGKVPAERLVVKDNVLFFKGDGRERGKIGLSPRRARPVAGSYDAGDGILTLVLYTKPEGVTDYVNSMWEIQKEPFAGDVVNSYNDGPPSPGAKPLGPFYELETSSPAGALKPGEALTHVQQTLHLQGSADSLDPIARATLGVSIAEITSALP